MTETTRHQTREALIYDRRNTGKKVFAYEDDEHFLVHGFYHFKHFPCDSPVRFMLHYPASHAFISLHANNKVSYFRPKCLKETIWRKLSFLGLTAIKFLGWLVGWGPGPIFTLLDNKLRHLDTAKDALDIQLCEAAEHSWELVTAGFGNVCVWSVLLMRCRVKLQEGLEQRTFTHMALAPPQKNRPHCAFLACGMDVTVIDLDNGKVRDQQEEFCLSNITAMLFCTQIDSLILAFRDHSITAWGLDWVPRVTFFGHNGVVNSLFYCSKSNMLISCSEDCTMRCWDVKNNLALDCFHTEQNHPPLCLGGIENSQPFFSFSDKGVDLWFLTDWYTLCTKIKGDEDIALKQILVSHLPPCYPTRVTCVSEDDHIYVVSVATAEIITSFKAGKRVLCADYCLPKELLIVLTKDGTLLQVNPLDNPATLIQEWQGRGLGRWSISDTVSKKNLNNLPTPGPACCMVIYSSLGDPEKALEKWKRLQSERDRSQHSKHIDHVKNRFWVIIGQSSGCVSVLTIDDGMVVYRTPAHNGKDVTAVKAYPKYNYLLSSGADLTVVIWKVHPDAATCLIPWQTVICFKHQVYLAALELQVALEFQEPTGNSYSLQLYHVENLKRAECQRANTHIDSLTGVCVIPEIKAFASCSLDKTVRIWNEKNKLIWVQHLVAAPQCMEYSGNGELFLGMNGDLYRLEFASFLPNKHRRTLRSYCFENVFPELPIPEGEETHVQAKMPTEEAETLQEAIFSNEIINVYMKEEQLTSVVTNMDLKALVKGKVNCTQKKTHSTKKTKKEAFEQYMHELYGLPPCEQIGLDEDDFEDMLTNSRARLMRSMYVPKPKPKVGPTATEELPKKQGIEIVKTKVIKKVSVLKSVTAKQAKQTRQAKQAIMEKARKVSSPVESTSQSYQWNEEQREKSVLRGSLFKPRSLSQLQKMSISGPSLLTHFSSMEWFSDLFPDRKSISSNLSPEDVFLELINYMKNSAGKSNSKVLGAIQAAQILQSQNLFDITEKQYAILTSAWKKFIQPTMTNQSCDVVVEMLNLLVDLKPEATYDVTKTIITLIANKELNVQKAVFSVLEGLGVHQAQSFLEKEFQNWGEGLEDNPNKMRIINEKAVCWMEYWTTRFKNYNSFLHIRTSSEWKEPSFSGVDVLKFFCLIKKQELSKSSFIPAAQKYKVIMPQGKWSFKPILRLGETYTMARKRKKTRYCLFEPRIPNWIWLPMSRVNLRLFHTNTYERLVRLPARTYFIPEHTAVEYYKQKFTKRPVLFPPPPSQCSATPLPTPTKSDIIEH